MLGLEVVGEEAPLGGRVAELELVRDLGADATLREVRAAGLAALVGEHLAIERGRDLVDIEHRDAFAACAPELGRLLDARHLDTEPIRELLGRLDEALALELHDEVEDVAVLLAAEAVKEALVGRHVERRRLLAVERAQTLPVATRLTQLHVLPDHADDVGRVADLRDDVVRNHRLDALPPRDPRTMTDPTSKREVQ